MSAPGGIFGDQSLNLGGHKIPYGFVAAGVGVIGLLLVLRARSTGSSVVAVGAPATPDMSGGGYQPYASIADLSTGLADLRQAITSGQITGPSAPPGAPPPDGTSTTVPSGIAPEPPRFAPTGGFDPTGFLAQGYLLSGDPSHPFIDPKNGMELNAAWTRAAGYDIWEGISDPTLWWNSVRGTYHDPAAVSGPPVKAVV